MFSRTETAVLLINQEYIQSFTITKEGRTANLQKIVDFLDNYCRENSICFVYGRGKRKSIHQRYYELFRRFLDRQLLYDLHNSRCGDWNSYSKTDVGATFMHMKEDHMSNGKSAVSRKISVSGRTCLMKKSLIHTLAMPESS